MYSLTIIDRDGEKHKLTAMGLDRIASNPGYVNVDCAYKIFSHVSPGSLERAVGEVGLLIGQDNAALLASGGDGPNVFENLRMMKTKFGTGHVLGGTYKDLGMSGGVLTPEAMKIRNIKHSSTILHGKKVHLLRNTQLPSYLEAEELGINVPRLCERCTGCSRCTAEAHQMSRKEQHELQLIRDNMVLDEENKCFVVSYTVVGDITKLKNNRYQVEKMATNVEKRLKKKDKLEAYNKEFTSYIERGVLVEVSDGEIKDYQEKGGVINFIGHHGVENEGSATTPLRLVANLSLKNCFTGPSVNDIWAKGPNSLNNLLEVLIRWRCYEEAVVWDLTKAYHSIRTTDKEKYLRLVVWRFDENGNWKVWAFVVVAFGDIPASVLLELVKDKAAELGKEIDGVAAARISNDSYVDDNLTGGTKEEVMKMV